jgi:RNA polymerase sigma factor (sigma-70 family)
VQPFPPPDPLIDVTKQPREPEPHDRLLADRVSHQGDEFAFRELYRRHTPRLYAFVLRLLAGNELDAEDVVQDTWIKAVEKLSQFRWESAFGTWLLGIGLNRCRELFRKKDRNWIMLEEEVAAVPREPLHDRIDLETALTELPPGYRTVVVLHDVEGFTHEEIAERLEISSNTSKSQLSRGRRALRSRLSSAPTGQVRVP